MTCLLLKAAVSGILIALASEVTRHNAGIGALIASLPLVSVLGMIWLWRDSHDPARMANHVGATLWYIAPSVRMFLLIPYLLRHGLAFWPSLGAGCALTFGLYLLMLWAANRWGIPL
jgi:hypothetical protein